jgi:hypothetical protein
MNERFLKLAMINFTGVKEANIFPLQAFRYLWREVERCKIQTVWEIKREKLTETLLRTQIKLEEDYLCVTPCRLVEIYMRFGGITAFIFNAEKLIFTLSLSLFFSHFSLLS